MKPLRYLCASVLALSLVILAPPSHADDRSATIAAVISDQIGAFQRDDLPSAFAHASPNIQQIFRNPERFGQMVQTGYPMVWRPAEFRMLSLGDTPRGLVQKVLFIDQAGRAWEADYQMIQIEGIWRINGVLLNQLPGISS